MSNDPQHAQPTQNDRPPVASLYNWMDSNRLRRFSSWEEEIEYAGSLGYRLAPPDHHIPHWTVAASGMQVQKLYVMRASGNLEELHASFDRPVRDIAYPLFFRVEPEVPCPST